MKTIVVIGGGFFGMYLSEYFSRTGSKVILIERENDFMRRASFSNQARVHNGYHYPRSILTALRSKVSFPQFVNDFQESICKEFEQYYFISRVASKVTSNQFEGFCKRIEIPCEIAPKRIRDLADYTLIEQCFATKEYAFDSLKLKKRMQKRLSQFENLKIYLNTEVLTVQSKHNKVIVKSIQRKIIVY